MRYAIIADIHANLAAFTAVLQDIGQRGGVAELWCLGVVQFDRQDTKSGKRT